MKFYAAGIETMLNAQSTATAVRELTQSELLQNNIENTTRGEPLLAMHVDGYFGARAALTE